MTEKQYDRQAAVQYAKKWANDRNPQFYNYDKIGGDCTNFASQCIYAGSGIMNYTPTFGWYYKSAISHSPSWTGVEYLYKFLTTNKGDGPYAIETTVGNIQPGDIIQLKFESDAKAPFEHSPVVIETGNPVTLDNIRIAAHTIDSNNRPLTTYDWADIRFIHIFGVRKW